MNQPSQAFPTQSSSRIQSLDVLRGFAILGIFVVNIEIMNCVFMNQDAFAAIWTEDIHQWTVRLQQLFFYNKFFPIFSLLFGIGIALQFVRWQQKDDSKREGLSRQTSSLKTRASGFGGISLFFWRRMAALFLIGTCHIVFLWSGDVIHLYAILGLFTSFCIKRSTKFLLITSIVLLIFPFYGQLFEFFAGLVQFEPQSALANYTSESIRETIGKGTYVDGMLLRMKEYIANIPLLYTFLAPMALSMFLLGVIIVKNNWIYNLKHHLWKIRKSVLLILLISNMYRLFFLFGLWDMEIWKDETWRFIFLQLMHLSDLLMALGYVWIIAALMQFGFWKRILKQLQYVGRMALTNYIFQSVVGLFVFTSIGFGKYETMSPTLSFAVALTTFVVQLLLSALWLRYFRFGPLEWLWRCISYWKWLPILKNT